MDGPLLGSYGANKAELSNSLMHRKENFTENIDRGHQKSMHFGIVNDENILIEI